LYAAGEISAMRCSILAKVMSPTGFTGRVIGIGFTTVLGAASQELTRIELAISAEAAITAVCLRMVKLY
jgi:hypothetical protein